MNRETNPNGNDLAGHGAGERGHASIDDAALEYSRLLDAQAAYAVATAYYREARQALTDAGSELAQAESRYAQASAACERLSGSA